VCTRDCGLYEVKNARRQTQIHTGKWARALNFWGIFDLKLFRQSKRKEKISGLISLFMKVIIPSTHSILTQLGLDLVLLKTSINLFITKYPKIMDEKGPFLSRSFDSDRDKAF
jgi:hypothetical protein